MTELHCIECETKLDVSGLEDEVIEAGLAGEAKCDACLNKERKSPTESDFEIAFSTYKSNLMGKGFDLPSEAIEELKHKSIEVIEKYNHGVFVPRC